MSSDEFGFSKERRAQMAAQLADIYATGVDIVQKAFASMSCEDNKLTEAQLDKILGSLEKVEKLARGLAALNRKDEAEELPLPSPKALLADIFKEDSDA